MQRVRVGLTGLACVFLLVFLAAAFFGLGPQDAAAPDAQDPAKPAIASNATAEPREPLAELGVTPGNVPGKAGPAAGAPAPAPSIAEEQAVPSAASEPR